MKDWGVWVRSDGAQLIVPLPGARRPRRNWMRVALGAFLLLLLVVAEGCCADEDRWFLQLHCADGAHEVECYTQASCQTLADAVLSIGTACESGSVGVRRACDE